MSEEAGKATFSREQQCEILESIYRLLEDKYVFPDSAARAISEVKDRSKCGLYTHLDGEAKFAEAITRDLQEITEDTHLRVVFDPVRVAKMQDAGKHRGNRDIAALAKLRNHGFSRVDNLKGNVGYVDIRHFFAPSISCETAAATMRFIADTDAVIVDLRNNTGGNPLMVQFLCSYFFDGETPIHLNSITSRPQRKTTEYWTLPHVPGKRMSNIALYILTSGHTFSGGEEFAYNIVSLKRGTIIGESTAGGANLAGIDAILDSFYVTIPHATSINPVTQTNWEGCGVKPHIETHADLALETAHILAIRQLIEKEEDDLAKTKLEWLLEEVVSAYQPIQVLVSTLESYVGKYGDTEISLGEQGLILRRRFFQYHLIPLSETSFWLAGPSAGFESRVEFDQVETGTIPRLVSRFPDGRIITHRRT